MEYLIVAAGYAFWIAVYLAIALPIRWYVRRRHVVRKPLHRGHPVR